MGEQEVVKHEVAIVNTIEICEFYEEDEEEELVQWGNTLVDYLECDDDEVDEDDYDPSKYRREVYEKQFDELDMEATEECERSYEDFRFNKRTPGSLIRKIDNYEQTLRRKLGHLQNCLIIQSKCYVLFLICSYYVIHY